MPWNVADTYFSNGFVTGSITGSSNSVTIMTRNYERKNAWVMNDTDGPVYLKFVSNNASSLSFSIKIPSQQLWEMPKPPLSSSMHVSCGGTGSVTWMDIS